MKTEDAGSVVLDLVGLGTYAALYTNSHEGGIFAGLEAGGTDWSVVEVVQLPFPNRPSDSWGLPNNVALGEIVLLVAGIGNLALYHKKHTTATLFGGLLGAFFIADAIVRMFTGSDLPSLPGA